jgi:hypothetical protein
MQFAIETVILKRAWSMDGAPGRATGFHFARIG